MSLPRSDDCHSPVPALWNEPTEAKNGRLAHLRGSALGFRNLTNYIVRSLLEFGGFSPNGALRG